MHLSVNCVIMHRHRSDHEEGSLEEGSSGCQNVVNAQPMNTQTSAKVCREQGAEGSRIYCNNPESWVYHPSDRRAEGSLLAPAHLI